MKKQTETNWKTYGASIPTAYGPLVVAATARDLNDAQRLAELHALCLLIGRGGQG